MHALLLSTQLPLGAATSAWQEQQEGSEHRALVLDAVPAAAAHEHVLAGRPGHAVDGAAILDAPLLLLPRHAAGVGVRLAGWRRRGGGGGAPEATAWSGCLGKRCSGWSARSGGLGAAWKRGRAGALQTRRSGETRGRSVAEIRCRWWLNKLLNCDQRSSCPPAPPQKWAPHAAQAASLEGHRANRASQQLASAISSIDSSPGEPAAQLAARSLQVSCGRAAAHEKPRLRSVGSRSAC